MRQSISYGLKGFVSLAIDPDSRHERVHRLQVGHFLAQYYEIVIVKNLFGVSPINVFQLGVIYMSCRQVLTPIHSSQLLPILGKFRLATFHKSATQRNYSIKPGKN